MTDDNSLTSAPIPRLTRRNAIPASIGFLFHTVFNITDTYFAGLIGTQALAALSLSFPVFFVIIAMGSGLQTGATACIATALGKGDKPQARILAAQSLLMGIIAGGALTIVGYTISPALFNLLGAEGAYLEDCLAYMQPIFGGTALFTILYMENAILNAQGDTVSFRNFLMIGALLNVGLDPWFIHGGMGLPAMVIL